MLLTLKLSMPETIKEVIKGKFWIVESTYGKVGTIRNTNNGFEFYNQVEDTTKILDSIDDFKTTGGSAVTAYTESQMYQGLPTNSPEIHPVEHETLPLFKKKANSKTTYVAGYYLLKYHGMGWQHAFCPKIDTYEKYETQGPFLSEWDMNLSLRKAKKEQ